MGDDLSPKDFMEVSDPQSHARKYQEKKRKLLDAIGVESPEARSSVSFVYKQTELMNTHVFDSPEDKTAAAAAEKSLNELLNLYNIGNDPFINKLSDSGRLATFFDQMLGISLYFTTQNSLNGKTYPTDFRKFMTWRDAKMEFEE